MVQGLWAPGKPPCSAWDIITLALASYIGQALAMNIEYEFKNFETDRRKLRYALQALG